MTHPSSEQIDQPGPPASADEATHPPVTPDATDAGGPLLFSVFDSARDSVPKVRTTDWAGLSAFLRPHRIVPKGEKTAQPAFSPAEWPDGEVRKASTVQRIHFAVLDLDKLSKSRLDRVVELADGLRAILYSTWSHAERHEEAGVWCCRLLVALSRPVSREEWPRFWARLNARLGGESDPKCKDPSRIYFVPSAPTERHAFFMEQEGAPLGVDALLADPEPKETDASAVSKVSREDLAVLSARLRRRKSEVAQATGSKLALVLKGASFAPQGERDEAIFRMAIYIAEAFPNADAEGVAAHFLPSLNLMNAEAPGCPTVSDVREKIARKQKEVIERRREEADVSRAAAARRISDAFGHGRTEPYTEDELNHFAEAAGTTREGFQKRWIVQNASSYYVFVDGDYRPSVTKETLIPSVERDLAPAVTAGVDVWAVTERGSLRSKRADELMLDYGSVAREVVVSLSHRRSFYEPSTQTFTEAACVLRPIKPEANQEVARWLELLGGDDFERLLDWVAVVTALEEPCAALYIDGAPGAGKTLLADGLARLWTTGEPTSLTHAIGNFNEDLIRCPLVLADEIMPEQMRRGGTTGDLRQFIQARRRPLSRKYKPNASLLGAVRLIMTANNRHLLETNESLTNNDIDAITERILYVSAGAEPRDYLRSLGFQRVREFVTEDQIAAHALHLAATRDVKRSARFIVSGRDSALHRSLTTSSGIRAQICQWMVSYLQEPQKMDSRGDCLVRRYGSELLVMAKALTTAWEVYVPDAKTPSVSRISGALSGLSRGKRQLRVAGKPQNYWRVDLENLIAWADETGYATAEEILGSVDDGDGQRGETVEEGAEAPF